MVALPILIIPFEDEYSVFGLSLAKLTILTLLIAVLLFESKRLLEMLKHPIFICSAAFLAWAFITELFHPSSGWAFVGRIGQTLFYSTLVAAAVKNLAALRRILMTLVLVSAGLAFYLFYNFHDLRSSRLDLKKADWARIYMEDGMGFSSNLNILSYTVGIGAIVALTKVLTTGGWRRIVWAAIYVLCAIGVTIPASRGAFLALAAGSGIMMWRSVTRSAKRMKQLFVMFCILVSLYAFASDTLTERLTSLVGVGGADAETGKEESRAVLLNLALQTLPQYWILGVGAGNFWDSWGLENGFSKERRWESGEITVGTHNGFLAVWIYFGLPGLSLLCLICVMAGRRAPPKSDKSWDALSLTGLLVLGLFWLVFTHDLYLKQFGMILGLVMARDAARHRVPVNDRKTVTRHLRHRATGSRRIGKATIPGAPTAIPKPNRITGFNA